MKKLNAIAAIVVFLFSALAFETASRAEDPAAMIVKVTGSVTVQRGGKQKEVKGKFPLKYGDKLVVPAGSSAQILYANGKKVNVKADYEVSQANSAIEGGKSNAASGLLVKSFGGGGGNADLKTKGGMGGAVRGAGGKANVQLLSFLNTNTTDTRPVFAWEPSSAAEKCSLSLKDEDGKEIWKTDTTDKVAAYPKENEALSVGKEYTVEVTCVIDNEPVQTSSTFYVMNADETKTVQESVTGIKGDYSADDDLVIQHMTLAAYYKEKELYMDAIDELKKLIALDANDLSSHKMLAEIYFKIGNKTEGAKEIKIADELQKDQGGLDEGDSAPAPAPDK